MLTVNNKSLLPRNLEINHRARISSQKYLKQIEWRRNKVKELLIRGYSQTEISDILHISQPTISRDINTIFQDRKRRQQRFGNEFFLNLQNTLAGITEIIKKSWTIVDDHKSDQKERMKAMSIILQCYDKRFQLLNGEHTIDAVREYIGEVVKADKEISRREKALQAYLEEKKLTSEEIDNKTDPKSVS
jgi:predicted transcriptional regulator